MALKLHGHADKTIEAYCFFFENVLEKTLPWLDLIKIPKTQRLPDVLTHAEIARIIRATHRFDFQSFRFVTYSIGLRLGE